MSAFELRRQIGDERLSGLNPGRQLLDILQSLLSTLLGLALQSLIVLRLFP